jgi:hypothetical protein
MIVVCNVLTSSAIMAAKEATATLVRAQAFVSIIARGAIASVAAGQASASIVADAAGSSTVLLRPTPHHDVKSRCKRRGMQARFRGQALNKLWMSSGMDGGGHVMEIKMRRGTMGRVSVKKRA